jgi:hypothetical protein
MRGQAELVDPLRYGAAPGSSEHRTFGGVGKGRQNSGDVEEGVTMCKWYSIKCQEQGPGWTSKIGSTW